MNDEIEITPAELEKIKKDFDNSIKDLEDNLSKQIEELKEKLLQKSETVLESTVKCNVDNFEQLVYENDMKELKRKEELKQSQYNNLPAEARKQKMLRDLNVFG